MARHNFTRVHKTWKLFHFIKPLRLAIRIINSVKIYKFSNRNLCIALLASFWKSVKYFMEPFCSMISQGIKATIKERETCVWRIKIEKWRWRHIVYSNSTLAMPVAGKTRIHCWLFRFSYCFMAKFWRRSLCIKLLNQTSFSNDFVMKKAFRIIRQQCDCVIVKLSYDWSSNLLQTRFTRDVSSLTNDWIDYKRMSNWNVL